MTIVTKEHIDAAIKALNEAALIQYESKMYRMCYLGEGNIIKAQELETHKVVDIQLSDFINDPSGMCFSLNVIYTNSSMNPIVVNEQEHAKIVEVLKSTESLVLADEFERMIAQRVRGSKNEF